MAEETQAVVPLPKDEGIAQLNSPFAAAELFRVKEGSIYCSLNLQDPAEKKLLSKIAGMADKRLLKAGEVVVNARHLYACDVELKGNAPGEIVEAVYVCILDTDGVTWAATSKGVRKSIGLLFASEGLPPWKDGLPLTVAWGKTRDGFDFPELRVVPKESPGKRASK